jgi:hypothetical protein
MTSSVARVEVREVSLPRCKFNAGGVHTGGEILEPCEKCGGEKVCGPFGHYCLACQPAMKIHCNICERPRVECCC